MDYEKKIDIPFGAHDSELKGWEYTIPEGMEAEIKDGKVIVREKASDDERIRNCIRCLTSLDQAQDVIADMGFTRQDLLAYLEKLKDASKAIEAVGRIDKYIDEHVANAHDMKDSNPDKKYYRGWDDALGKMAGVLQDVYSNEKQKENPKSADSIPSDCMSSAKFEDRWHKVADSLPGNPREVLCKDEAGNYFIGRYYVGEGWEISNYDDEDKPHHLNPPVSKWIDFPSEKQKEQKPTNSEKPKEWSEEDDALLKEIVSFFKDGTVKLQHDLDLYAGFLQNKFKSLRPQPREEIYQSAKHDLAIKFMNYLDENRPEGKMCLSNGECEDIDKAFKENDWAKIMRYVEKYRPSWKPSDEQMQCLLAVITNQYNAGAESCHLTLGSLYNDLKKLI